MRRASGKPSIQSPGSYEVDACLAEFTWELERNPRHDGLPLDVPKQAVMQALKVTRPRWATGADDARVLARSEVKGWAADADDARVLGPV